MTERRAYQRNNDQDLWDESADRYSALAPRISFYHQTNRRIAELVSCQAGMNVLEVGCGSTGLLASYLIQTCSDLGRLICIDTSKRMIEIATMQVCHPKLTFVQGDLTTLRLKTNLAFDCILVNSAFFWTQDPLSFFMQVSEVLSPAGQFIFSLAEWHYEFGESANNNPKYAVIQRQLRKRNLHLWATRRSMVKLTLNQIVESVVASGMSVESIVEFETPVSLEDWKAFYRIPAIAKRSLPQVDVDEALDIWRSALSELEVEEASGTRINWRPLRWIFFECSNQIRS